MAVLEIPGLYFSPVFPQKGSKIIQSVRFAQTNETDIKDKIRLAGRNAVSSLKIKGYIKTV